VFGGTSRLVRLIGSQHANTGVATAALDYVYNPAGVDGVNRKVSDKTDALAIAPYFGYELGNNPQVTILTSIYDPTFPSTLGDAVDYAINFADADVDTQLTKVATNKSIADARGIRLVGYEGGQHMVGVSGWENYPELTKILTTANRDPRMEAIYQRYIEGWRTETGDDVFCAFTLLSKYNKYGSWGLLEWNDAPATPKYTGLLNGFGTSVVLKAAPAATTIGLAALVLLLAALGVLTLRRKRGRMS
jgi:hypothetical protein